MEGGKKCTTAWGFSSSSSSGRQLRQLRQVRQLRHFRMCVRCATCACCFRFAPFGPLAPGAPLAPVSPVAPVAPVAPLAPVVSLAPVASVAAAVPRLRQLCPCSPARRACTDARLTCVLVHLCPLVPRPAAAPRTVWCILVKRGVEFMGHSGPCSLTNQAHCGWGNQHDRRRQVPRLPCSNNARVARRRWRT